MDVHIVQIVWLDKNVQLYSHMEEHCFALLFDWSGAQCPTKRKYEWQNPNLTIASYSLSRPFDSFHLRNETDASTLAGDEVFGSFNKEIILNRIVLKSTERKDPKLKYNITSIITIFSISFSSSSVTIWTQEHTVHSALDSIFLTPILRSKDHRLEDEE